MIKKKVKEDHARWQWSSLIVTFRCGVERMRHPSAHCTQNVGRWWAWMDFPVKRDPAFI